MPAATLTAEFDRVIQAGPARFSYFLRLREDSSRLDQLLTGLDADRFILITDRKAPSRHVARMRDRLAGLAPCTVQPVPPGEETRTLAGMMDLADAGIRAGVTRRSVVVTFGGETAGSVGCLLATLLLEGIRLVHVPTTLLAMTDSALSVKQSVYTREGKSLLTKLHAPEFVWADLNYAKPPPVTELRSALCEMIKLVLAIAPERFDWVAARLRPDASYTTWDLADFAGFCIDTKRRVLAGDPRETSQAIALEYGHGIGRAVESLVPGGMSHGLAIGLGMLAAARVAGELGFLTASDQHAHRVLLERAGAPAVLPYRVPPRDFLALMHQAGDRGSRQPQRSAIRMVLLDRLGALHRDQGLNLTQVPDRTVERAIGALQPPLPARPRSTALAR